MEGEGGPVVGRFAFFPELELGLSEGRGMTFFGLPEGFVKLLHEFGGAVVVYVPEGACNAECACIHESACHPDRAFTGDVVTESGLAGAEDDEFGGEVEVEEFGETQVGFSIDSLGVVAGEDDAGECRFCAVEEAVGGEVDVAILADVFGGDPVVVGLESEGGGPIAFLGNEAEDGFCFGGGAFKSAEVHSPTNAIFEELVCAA